ncbi:AAA family ATPase [Campylobacter sp. IFREMER_LSEM_CL2256]|uniref:AAA family ATPase n=1 Tax=Campylobacter sp. IFREMER_LSEM_CL2256 TaxID=2911622 RepID=UPI0021E98DFE|nr:AAA family ATPase [Campylobacter sp. IFREMER_LSEM_CL2256]MCV3387161.1 AAA family ATPase [Campylobacter sp. IFREMER_LSEM_CL2256]
MIDFLNEEKERFINAIDELIKQVDDCILRDKKTQRGDISNKGSSSQNIKQNLSFISDKYNYSFKIAIGNSNGFLSNDCWIMFVRKDLLEENLINGKKITPTKGVHLFIAYSGYFQNNKHLVLKFGFPKRDIENSRCIAVNKMESEGYLQRFDFTYGLDNKDKLIKDFSEMMNYFNSLNKDDFKSYENSKKQEEHLKIKSENLDIKNLNKNKNPPLNQILYGSPGTGKTYRTIDKALEILGENLANKDRDEKKAKFDEYVKNGQIVFTTFHQSYGYEEFVEGIKPRIDSKENSKEVEYEIKDGIFKELCKKALDNYKVSLLTQEEFVKSEDLENKIEIFLDELVDQQKFIEKTQSGGFKLEEYNEKYRIITDDTNANLYLNLEIFKMLLENKDKIINGRSIKQILNNKHRRQIDSYYFQLVKLFKEREQDYKVDNNPSEKPELKPYIIIIDEINRGNVSKIFGELITLIEPSKRIGADEELKVTLPYSKDEFGVPKNVYIIGTMNTADRSITSLDTALRRRFEFVEMMPKPNVLSDNCEGVNLQKLLEAINTRIEYLLDREKTIGHAFFIGIDSLEKLKNVFQNKIIPLLQEYFYNDYALIDAVLNKNGMLEKQDINSDYLKNMTDFIESGNVVYKFSDSEDWVENTFIKIYEQ